VVARGTAQSPSPTGNDVGATLRGRPRVSIDGQDKNLWHY